MTRKALVFVVSLLAVALSASVVDAQIGAPASSPTLQASNSTVTLAQNETAFGVLVSNLRKALQARLSAANLSSLNATQTPQSLQNSLNLSLPISVAASITLSTLVATTSNISSNPALRFALFVTAPLNASNATNLTSNQTFVGLAYNVTSLNNQTAFLRLSLTLPSNSSANSSNTSSLAETFLPLNGSLVLGALLTLSNGTAAPTTVSLNGTLTVVSNLTSNGTLNLGATLVFGTSSGGNALGPVGALSPGIAPLPQNQPLAPVGSPPGQFSNPVMFAEFADPDVIRVQNDFYMAATSFHMFPGAQIMHSRDLINWEYLSHAIPNLPPSIDAKCYSLDGCDRYGVGTWANSLRFHNNTFYLMTNMNDNGVLLSRASNPAGPWTFTALGWYCQDPGLFFDDDGSIYAACGHGTLEIYTLGPDFQPLSNVQIVNDTVKYPGFASNFYGIEGSHMYKTNGTYYIYALWGGGQGQQLALRATQPTGPYSYYKVLQGLGEDNLGYKKASIHQGCLVNTTNGEWWSYLLQDHDAVGRLPIIQQVKFVEGWPTIGDGKAQQTVPYPSGIYTPSIFPATSDEFNGTSLGMQWQWNHLPDNTKWSLAERPGYMTLHTATVTPNGNLTKVRNQLTQRTWGPYSVATVALDVSKMVDGDVAGLSIFQVRYAYIGVQKTGSSLAITQVANENATATVPFSGTGGVVYLQATFNEGSQQASFAYSTDGQSFTPLGASWTTDYMVTKYVGFRFGIFILNTAGSLQGSAAFDYMRVSIGQRNSA